MPGFVEQIAAMAQACFVYHQRSAVYSNSGQNSRVRNNITAHREADFNQECGDPRGYRVCELKRLHRKPMIPCKLWSMRVSSTPALAFVCLVLPITNLFAFLYLAFSDSPAKKEERGSTVMTLEAA